MRIGSIGANYYNSLNAGNSFSNKKNVSFGDNRRYILAYKISENKEEVKKFDDAIVETQAKIEKTLKEMRKELKSCRNLKKFYQNQVDKLEAEYKAYNPPAEEFEEDVKKGCKLSNRGFFWSLFSGGDDESPSENRAAEFTASDGWPAYAP